MSPVLFLNKYIYIYFIEGELIYWKVNALNNILLFDNQLFAV